MYTSMKLCVRERPMWMQHFLPLLPSRRTSLRLNLFRSAMNAVGFSPPACPNSIFSVEFGVDFFFYLSLSLPATPHRSCPVSSMFFICHCIGKHHACVPLLCWFASFLPFSFFLLKFLIIEMGRKYVYNALVIQLNLVVAAAKLVGCVSKDCHCRLRRRALTIHTRIVSRTKRRVALHLLKPTGCIYVSVFSGSDWRID